MLSLNLRQLDADQLSFFYYSHFVLFQLLPASYIKSWWMNDEHQASQGSEPEACAGAPPVVPFLGVLRDEGLKNFFTVVTFRVFSLVFFSSNLENGAREECPGCDAADWAWGWGWTPWLLAYAASSSLCNLGPREIQSSILCLYFVKYTLLRYTLCKRKKNTVQRCKT